jgi:hypothetical protein
LGCLLYRFISRAAFIPPNTLTTPIFGDRAPRFEL